MNDPINHPHYYNTSSIEPIDVIEAWRLPYHLGNTLKYIARHEHKENPLQDLLKAQWYLNRYVQNELQKINSSSTPTAEDVTPSSLESTDRTDSPTAPSLHERGCSSSSSNPPAADYAPSRGCGWPPLSGSVTQPSS